MDLSWTTDHRDGVTLVACRLRNPTPVARRVRLANELAGPVLPPRTHGEPLPGWDADGVTLRVEPEATAALGYAVPAPPTEPPAAVAFDEPARDDAAEAPTSESRPGVSAATTRDPGNAEVREPTAADAVRTLGSYRPPRDAVTARASDQFRAEAPRNGEPASVGSSPTGRTGASQADSPTDQPTAFPTDSSTDPPTASPADPAAVDAWLDAVERRVARAEQLDGADVPTATEVVAAAGGLDAVRELDEKVADDAGRLRTVAKRAAALADRAAAAEVPTDPLGRLA